MSEDPYASHLAVLDLVCQEVQPRRVLEMGAGRYSTPFFLDNVPTIERLVSVERDPVWHEKIVDLFEGEEGMSLRYTTDGIMPFNFDLILIDDGQEPTERLGTIRWVLGEPHPVTVIHDAEYPAYNELIKRMSKRVDIYDALVPNTAVVWD